jgi:hypothetical protein
MPTAAPVAKACSCGVQAVNRSVEVTAPIIPIFLNLLFNILTSFHPLDYRYSILEKWSYRVMKFKLWVD